jgi:predicted ATP-grasp superfamily ATP-dependent carboligase
MVQEMIGGRDERLVTFLGYFTESHEPDSFFIRKKMRQCPIDFGYCTMTESCHNPTVLTQSVALLKEMKYHGVAGVEWKLDPATETYKLIEINARPVNTTGCAMASGVDLPAIAYFSKIGAPLPSVTDWQDGQRWAWLSMDFWAAKELKAEGKLSFGEWLRSVKGIKADAIFAWDDFWILSVITEDGSATGLKQKAVRKPASHNTLTELNFSSAVTACIPGRTVNHDG